MAATAARAAQVAFVRLPARSASGLLDRLLRGRAWVVFIGVLLVGIVFLNVAVLGVNGDIAYLSERTADLRRGNAELRLEVAALGSTERIQRLAGAQGLVMPEPGQVTYLAPDREADAARAVAALAALEPDGSPDELAAVPPAPAPVETASELPVATQPPAATAP